MQFQLTCDRKVAAHFPLLPCVGVDTMPILKEPLHIAARPPAARSRTHGLLVQEVIENTMKADCQMGDFEYQTGKAGHFRGRIKQAHRPHTRVNGRIALAFPTAG